MQSHNMNFQEKLLDSFIAFEQDVDLLNPIHKDRKDALKRFEELVLGGQPRLPFRSLITVHFMHLLKYATK